MLLAGVSIGAAAAVSPDRYKAAVDNPARSDKDRVRDVREHPAQFMAFAGIKPGMTVADIFGGGGYYSELISYVVGPKGKVLLVNNPPYDKYAHEELEPRLANGRLPNVVYSEVDPADLKLAPNSVDVALIVMSYHDLFYAEPEKGWPAIDAGRFLEQIHAALKRGGKFVIVDHAAAAGSGTGVTGTLHRIDEDFAKKDIAAHGFKLLKTWDALRNPADDRTKLVFDPAIRGKTDRFVHLYVKT